MLDCRKAAQKIDEAVEKVCSLSLVAKLEKL
jgi:hypothetical protein